MRFSALYDHAARRRGEQEQGFAALVSPEQKKRGSAVTSDNPGLCCLSSLTTLGLGLCRREDYLLLNEGLSMNANIGTAYPMFNNLQCIGVSKSEINSPVQGHDRGFEIFANVAEFPNFQGGFNG